MTKIILFSGTGWIRLKEIESGIKNKKLNGEISSELECFNSKNNEGLIVIDEITIDVFELQEQIYALLKSNIKESVKSGLHELLGVIKDCLMSNRKIVLCRHEQALFNLVGMKVMVSAAPDDRSAMHNLEFHGTVKSINPDMNYATILDTENHCFNVDFDLIEKIHWQ